MYWVFGRERKVLGNSLVSWLLPTVRWVRFFRLPIDSGSSVETRCSFCQYCVLGFRWGGQGSQKTNLTVSYWSSLAWRSRPPFASCDKCRSLTISDLAASPRWPTKMQARCRLNMRSDTVYWIFGGARKVLGNSLVSWLLEHLKSLRLARSPMLSGSSVETGCSFCQYCVLGFRQGEEDSRKLTGQLVALKPHQGEACQLSD